MRTFRMYEQGYAMSRGKMERVMIIKQNDVWTQVTFPCYGSYWNGPRRGRVKSDGILPLPSTNSWSGSV